MKDTPTAPSDEATATRSEEQLRVTTHRREIERARLLKYVETEIVMQVVERRREQVRIEREPISPDANAPHAAAPADIGDRWLVLYDEEVVLTTRRVPRERVRLRTHAVIEDRVVSEVLRAERIDVVESTEDPAPPA